MVTWVNSSQQDDPTSVQREDQYPCRVCQVYCNTGLKCSDCHMWLHYLCSKVPTYVLINLTRSTRKYTYEDCTKVNHTNFDELCTEIEQYKVEEGNAQKQELEDQTLPNTPDTPQASNVIAPSTPAPPTGQESSNTSTSEPPATSTTANTGEPNNLSQPTNSTGKPAPVVDKRKLVVCKFYLRNECRYGAAGRNCRNAHPKICSKFMKQGLDERVGCRLG